MSINSNTNSLLKCTTHGVTIEVEVQFQTGYSIPYSDQNVFTYHILIHNSNPYTVQLLRRHWHIWESNGSERQVRGEGVIGLQPIIGPNEIHQYESFCPIGSSIGKMRGQYQMIRLDTNEKFEATIPQFNMITPEILN